MRDNTYWSGLASAYAALGPPLKPSPADIAYLETAVAGWVARHPARRLRALLLGVTPAIAAMRWPRRAIVRAADYSLPMIQHVWPGDVPGRRAAACADWRALPLRKASCDIIIGDGSINCLRYPHGFHTLAAEARRVLREDGLLILRSYIQPPAKERAEDLMAGLCSGAMPSFHWFKFRLLMALQESTGQGVAVDTVYRCWAERQIDEAALAARTGWDPAVIRMIELYRGKETVHSFPTLTELRAVLREFFEETPLSAPPQTVNECCPIVIAAPRRERKAWGASACST